MFYDCKRISYWIDRRLSGLAGPDYDATISFGLPLEPEDCQYGKSRFRTSCSVAYDDEPPQGGRGQAMPKTNSFSLPLEIAQSCRT